MPKQKTRSAAKKRFKVTGTGKIRHRHAFSSHNFEHKSRKRKRSFRKDQAVHDVDAPKVRKLLGSYFSR